MQYITMMAVLIFSNVNLVSLRYYFSFVNILNETLFYIFRYSNFVMHFFVFKHVYSFINLYLSWLF